MGKGNLIQGMGRGKLGDTVFYRSQGEQMFRMRNRNPKNPKSQAQMIQRSIMATVVQAYSAMSKIVNHSFESVPYGVKSMNYFNKVNADNLRSLYATDVAVSNIGAEAKARVTAPKVSALIANSYIVSKGSLASPFQILAVSDGQGNTNFQIDYHGAPANAGEVIKSIGIYETESMITRVRLVTAGGFIYAYDGDSSMPGAAIPRLTFVYDRIVRNSTPIDAEDAAKAFSATEGDGKITYEQFASKYLNATNTSNTFSAIVKDILTGGETTVVNNAEIGLAIIASQKVGTVWKRSSEVMLIKPEANLGLDSNYGILAWSQGTTEVGSSEWYLNKGDLSIDVPKLQP